MSSHILADCVLFLTILSTGYLIYRTVYKYARCKKNLVYGLYWGTVLFSIDVFLITVTSFEPDAIMQPQLITFLILEFIVSVLIVYAGRRALMFPQKLQDKTWERKPGYQATLTFLSHLFQPNLLMTMRTVQTINRKWVNSQGVIALLYTVQAAALLVSSCFLTCFCRGSCGVVDNISIGNICWVCALYHSFVSLWCQIYCSTMRNCSTPLSKRRYWKNCLGAIKLLITLIVTGIIYVVADSIYLLSSTHSLSVARLRGKTVGRDTAPHITYIYNGKGGLEQH